MNVVYTYVYTHSMRSIHSLTLSWTQSHTMWRTYTTGRALHINSTTKLTQINRHERRKKRRIVASAFCWRCCCCCCRTLCVCFEASPPVWMPPVSFVLTNRIRIRHCFKFAHAKYCTFETRKMLIHRSTRGFFSSYEKIVNILWIHKIDLTNPVKIKNTIVENTAIESKLWILPLDASIRIKFAYPNHVRSEFKSVIESPNQICSQLPFGVLRFIGFTLMILVQLIQRQ